MRATCSPRSCCSRVTTRRVARPTCTRATPCCVWWSWAWCPVVNENDTVTVDEIKFGDNDTLAALVSCLVSADLCVTLSDIDGLYTANPHEDPTAEFVPVVHKIDAKIIASAGDSSTSVGTGGMITKIRASRILMTAGIQSVICSGEEPMRSCASPAARAWARCSIRRRSVWTSHPASCGSHWATRRMAR